MPPVTGAVGGTLDTNTVLLIHADGTNGSTAFVDSSSYARTLTAVGTAQVTTSSSKFGTGSLKVDIDKNSYIDSTNASDFQFGSGQFTVEYWAYYTSQPPIDASGTYMAAVSQWAPEGNDSWWFGHNNTNGLDVLLTATGSYDVTRDYKGPFIPTLNTWYHIAFDRDATSTLRMYVNGAVVSTTSDGGALFASTQTCAIGDDHGSSADGFPGYLDEIRVTKGLARYGGAFTPATAPFTVSTPLAQAAQTLAAAGTVGAASAITGTLAVTEANDSIAAAGTVLVSGTLSRTQANQTLAAAGGTVIGGTLTVNQAAQTLVAVGGPRVGGTLGVAQAPQTLLALGGPRVGGTLGVAQQTHTLLATGTVGAGAAITGSLVVTQAPQSLVALATVAAAASANQARAFVLA